MSKYCPQFTVINGRYWFNEPSSNEWVELSLTHFRLMFLFYTPWKHQQTPGFLFSGGIEEVLAWIGLKPITLVYLRSVKNISSTLLTKTYSNLQRLDGQTKKGILRSFCVLIRKLWNFLWMMNVSRILCKIFSICNISNILN